MRKVTIKGIDYELVKKGTRLDNHILWHLDREHQNRTLWDCYNRPSQAKQDIWDKWVCELNDTSEWFTSVGVASYSCMIFTIIAVNADYIFYITPSHNYVIIR